MFFIFYCLAEVNKGIICTILWADCLYVTVTHLNSPVSYCAGHTDTHTTVVGSCHPGHMWALLHGLRFGLQCSVTGAGYLSWHGTSTDLLHTPEQECQQQSGPSAEWVSAGGIHVPKIRCTIHMGTDAAFRLRWSQQQLSILIIAINKS